jgi:hypothetical protein
MTRISETAGGVEAPRARAVVVRGRSIILLRETWPHDRVFALA